MCVWTAVFRFRYAFGAGAMVVASVSGYFITKSCFFSRILPLASYKNCCMLPMSGSLGAKGITCFFAADGGMVDGSQN